MSQLARRQRGIARASITRLEDRINKMEEKGKEEFKESDRLAVQRLIKRLETLDADFKKHHVIIVGATEEEERLEEEPTLLDEHDDRVSDFAERLLALVSDKPEEHKPSTLKSKLDSAHRLHKRI